MISKSIRFLWDISQDALDEALAPLPQHPTDTCDYIGAVFFGTFKLEFIRNDVAGVYCNLFEYGAEDDPGSAYAYLDDGTPYEERYPVSDEITVNDIGTLDEFAKDIEHQIIKMIDRHPDFRPGATKHIPPEKWYPGNCKYKPTITMSH